MTKTLSHYVEGLKLGAQIDARGTAGIRQGQLVFLPLFETEQAFLTASSTSSTVYVADTVSGLFQIAAIEVVYGTTSSSGTLQVEVATGTTAVGSGTNQLTGTVSLSGTANTAIAGTLIATPTVVTAGSRINVILAGTLTGLANCTVNVTLQRVG